MRAASLWDILPDMLLAQILVFCILVVGLLALRYFKRINGGQKRWSNLLTPTVRKLLFTVLFFVLPFVAQGIWAVVFNSELWVHGIPGCWYLQPGSMFHINNCPFYLQWVLLLVQIILSYFLSCCVVEFFNLQKVKKK
jgi:hypothetical protein